MKPEIYEKKISYKQKEIRRVKRQSTYIREDRLEWLHELATFLPGRAETIQFWEKKRKK